jgi:hypothetical protein
MSQTHAVAIPSRSRIHRLAPLVLVTLVLALVTLALVQADGGNQVAEKSPAAPTGAIRYGDFNPATGSPSLSTVRPNESAIAAAIGAGVKPEVAGADESSIAAAIGGGHDSGTEGPAPFSGRR